ncbi:uncharacterized protein LOC108595940 [Drosophila busckii]|uniref:uncharacterized protein LOC108595940 n=1 Tax=Drosophila busckii TaxID=30019 RepID=UPI00143296C6|nr:uncharacterized protein LOC108595940 [Drosophila busckii]
MRLFVKAALFQDVVVFQDVIKKEATLYSTLLNKLMDYSDNLWCGKCYYSRDNLFVMQNIEDLGYAQLPEDTRFLSEQQLYPLLKSLATLHASSIAYERRQQTTIAVEFKDCLQEFSIDPEIPWWQTGIKAVLAVAATHPLVAKDLQAQVYIAQELPKHLTAASQMVNPSTKHRNVFLHRDSWLGNVFFHKSQSELCCVLVDFQLCRYAPPAIDFLMATHFNLEPALQRELQPRLVAYYYENLQQQLQAMQIVPAEEQLSRAEFEQSLQDLALFGVVYNCVVATVLHLPKDYLKNLKQHSPEEFQHFSFVDRTESILSLMREHADYKRYMYDCLEDLLALTYCKQNKK